MQMRICDCQKRIGGCFCELKTKEDDKRTIQDSARDNREGEHLL